MPYQYISGQEIEDPNREQYVIDLQAGKPEKLGIALEKTSERSYKLSITLMDFKTPQAAKDVAEKMRYMLATEGLSMSEGRDVSSVKDYVTLRTGAGTDIDAIVRAVRALGSDDISVPKTNGKELFSAIIDRKDTDGIVRQEQDRIRNAAISRLSAAKAPDHEEAVGRFPQKPGGIALG